jgi:hypothetical protein
MVSRCGVYLHRDYGLYELSNEEFEQLVVQICVRWLGPGVTLFAPGKDDGRDGKFSRKANCAEFRKRRGRRSSGLCVTRGPQPAARSRDCQRFAGSP